MFPFQSVLVRESRRSDRSGEAKQAPANFPQLSISVSCLLSLSPPFTHFTPLQERHGKEEDKRRTRGEGGDIPFLRLTGTRLIVLSPIMNLDDDGDTARAEGVCNEWKREEHTKKSLSFPLCLISKTGKRSIY